MHTHIFGFPNCHHCPVTMHMLLTLLIKFCYQRVVYEKHITETNSGTHVSPNRPIAKKTIFEKTAPASARQPPPLPSRAWDCSEHREWKTYPGMVYEIRLFSLSHQGLERFQLLFSFPTLILQLLGVVRRSKCSWEVFTTSILFPVDLSPLSLRFQAGEISGGPIAWCVSPFTKE